MPEQETHNTTDIQHAKLLAEKFGFNIQVIDISSTLKTFFQSLPIYDATHRRSKGNVKARIRMIYLYYYANKLNRLVCGTSDKSETMIGYFTKWGDGAADISPIMDLYKTHVRQLATHVGVPTEIVNKPPSPGLWSNQLAEKELGIKYETLDLVLFGLEHFMKPGEISGQLNLPVALVEAMKSRWLASEHKRRLPLTTKFGFRTVGKDFRVPQRLQ
jgi:NAD+ synthase